MNMFIEELGDSGVVVENEEGNAVPIEEDGFDDMREQIRVTHKALQVQKEALSETQSRKWAYERQVKDSAARLADLEDQLANYRTAVHLGEKPEAEEPSATEIVGLHADIAAEPRVISGFDSKIDDLEKSAGKADLAYKKAVFNYLNRQSLRPALNELEDAFAAVKAAATKVMAAHEVMYYRNYHKDIYPNSHNDFGGPTGNILGDLTKLNWEEWPYSVRPSWLPKFGQFFPFDMALDEKAGLEAHIAEVCAS